MIYLCIFLVILVVMLFFSTKNDKASSQPDKLPYVAKNRLMSNAELSFYHVLASNLVENTSLCPKVRISDIVAIEKSIEKGARMSFLGRISQKHVDFVVIDNNTSKIIAAIELDDSSHGSERVKKRDNFVNEVFKVANIPLLRFPAQRGYQAQQIQLAFQPLGIGNKPHLIHSDT